MASTAERFLRSHIYCKSAHETIEFIVAIYLAELHSLLYVIILLQWSISSISFISWYIFSNHSCSFPIRTFLGRQRHFRSLLHFAHYITRQRIIAASTCGRRQNFAIFQLDTDFEGILQSHIHESAKESFCHIYIRTLAVLISRNSPHSHSH